MCAAFLAYNGFFDQNYRASLLKKWKRHLEALNVSIKPDLSIINYLSHPDERLQWHANKLPNDDLCVENAIMLQRFNRYPLVIDPSGRVNVLISFIIIIIIIIYVQLRIPLENFHFFFV